MKLATVGVALLMALAIAAVQVADCSHLKLPVGRKFISILHKVIDKCRAGHYDDQESYDEIPVEFDCKLKRSRRRPSSVHQLRPADFDVIGAMGDSLTAGLGALADNLQEVGLQFRGYAFSIGGDGILESHITLPNIIKRGNYRLYGESTGTRRAKQNSMNASLNVAVVGCPSAHMLTQAKDLVNRMKQDSFVDFRNGWKLVTIFVGANDACDWCKDKKSFCPTQFTSNIQSALDYLHKNLPRTFVNVVEPLDVTIAQQILLEHPDRCSRQLMQFLCPCIVGDESNAIRVSQVVRQYQLQVRQLIQSGRYDTRSDFTVVSQPFASKAAPPRVNGKYDLSFMAPDCFHLSKKGHSAAAKGLWNNMLEPLGKKSESWLFDSPLNCPTKKHPYIMTSKNSAGH